MKASILQRWRDGGGTLVFLTGAGVSAESGIPTFRGKDGFWTVGSTHYTPIDLATRAAFARDPETVWNWYLWRFAKCAAAQPNAAHHAIARLQAAYGRRIVLVTQNVDGLHQRAGSPPERTFPIHGDARFVRCARGCVEAITPMPPEAVRQDEPGLSAAARVALTCSRCGGWMRPHVLWFDEYYDEPHYRAASALAAAQAAS